MPHPKATDPKPTFMPIDVLQTGQSHDFDDIRAQHRLITNESVFLGQAEMEKFSKSTFSERKIMSTKTSIKRIAAVAAVALTLGGFSAVSAHAAAAPAVAVTGGAGTSSAATGSPVVGTYAAITFTAGSADKLYTISSSGVGSIAVPSISASNVNNPLASLATAGVSSVGATVFGSTTNSDVPGASTNHVFAGTEQIALSAYSATAGTQTITFKGDSSAAVTATLTWGAAPVVKAQYTTSALTGVTASQLAADVTLTNTYSQADATIVASSTATYVSSVAQPVAVIGVSLASSSNTPITAPLSASITGAGVLGIVADNAIAGATLAATVATTAPALGSAISAGSAGDKSFYRVSVYPDGRSGVGTVTISSGTTVLATKTVTFYGSATAVSATQGLYVAKAGTGLGGVASATAYSGASVAATAAITASVTDVNKNPVELGSGNWGTAIKAVSSDSSVITVVLGAEITASPGTWQIQVAGANAAPSGAKATVTVQVYNAATSAWDIVAAPLTFQIGGGVSNVSLSTDATSYSPLAPVKLIATVTDSKGNPAYDQDFANGANSTLITSLTTTAAFAGTNGFVSPTAVINGVGKFGTLYAPSIEGTITVAGVDAQSAAGEAVSTKFEVANGAVLSASSAAVDAANEATDAANAATDAANNAMDSADAAQQAALDAGDKADAALAAVTDLATKVSAIASQIASLSALVKKIAAKVKA